MEVHVLDLITLVCFCNNELGKHNKLTHTVHIVSHELFVTGLAKVGVCVGLGLGVNLEPEHLMGELRILLLITVGGLHGPVNKRFTLRTKLMGYLLYK